jgi:hypothetical protein
MLNLGAHDVGIDFVERADRDRQTQVQQLN